jgi:hypothetical protein
MTFLPCLWVLAAASLEARAGLLEALPREDVPVILGAPAADASAPEASPAEREALIAEGLDPGVLDAKALAFLAGRSSLKVKGWMARAYWEKLQPAELGARLDAGELDEARRLFWNRGPLLGGDEREFLAAMIGARLGRKPRAPASRRLGRGDEAFLDDLERRNFAFFIENADPGTGLVLDRARFDGSPHDEAHRRAASIASTGFGLSALVIGAERGWISRGAARERVKTALRFFADKAPHERGWFYHFMDSRTGKRIWNSEVSSIDTAFLLAGALTARQYFREDREIARLAGKIYKRVDFPWMLNGHETRLALSWTPEQGFCPSRWDTYSEHAILYLLGMGSPSHPLPAKCWDGWSRDWMEYGGYRYLGARSPWLFIHQFSQGWLDLRGLRDSSGVDYFRNSQRATRAHWTFCQDLSKDFPSYAPDLWGVSTSDGPRGYVEWGGPWRNGPIDGSVVPYAAGGSLAFTPDISLPALRRMKEEFGSRVYGRYGFVDAFHPGNGWTGPDVVGIDNGITLLSAENLRSGGVWKWFMRNPEVRRALAAAGLRRAR